MKKALWILVLTVALAACSQDDGAKKAEAKSAAGTDVVSSPDYLDGYIKNPQLPDDSELLEAGQIVEDSKGRSTLLKMNQVDKTYQIGGIELTIRDTKLIHLRPAYSMIDYFHGLTHESEFDFAKFFIEVKNISDKNLKFNPIAMIETNENEQVSWEDDVYLDGLNEVMEPGQSRKGNIGFILEDIEEISSITLTTSDVYDEEDKKVADAQPIEIMF